MMNLIDVRIDEDSYVYFFLATETSQKYLTDFILDREYLFPNNWLSTFLLITTALWMFEDPNNTIYRC